MSNIFAKSSRTNKQKGQGRFAGPIDDHRRIVGDFSFHATHGFLCLLLFFYLSISLLPVCVAHTWDSGFIFFPWRIMIQCSVSSDVTAILKSSSQFSRTSCLVAVCVLTVSICDVSSAVLVSHDLRRIAALLELFQPC